ncbi:hypothetical protein GTW37_39710, partial [Streptomyces sp. SID4931]|nr:hypothetical protein [Streptomyces sp. SID4931]
RLVRTAIEVAVVVTGFLLGGSLGVGTVLYALAIGPLAQFFLRLFTLPEASAPGVVVASGEPSTPAPAAGSGPVAAPTSGQAILPQ